MGTKVDDELALYDQQTQAMQRPWSREEFPRLAGWLSANKKPMGLAVEASKRSRQFDPVICDDGMMIWAVLPGIEGYKEVVRTPNIPCDVPCGVGATRRRLG